MSKSHHYSFHACSLVASNDNQPASGPSISTIRPASRKMRWTWIFATLVLSAGAGAANAQQLVYTPVNPSFGGNPFNSTQLLANANAQNQYKPEAAKTPTQAQLFAQQLQSRLLTALATQVTDAIFGANPQNSGTITFGDQTISFVRTLDSVNLTIVDGTGTTTQITVPTFVKVQ